MKKYAIYCGLNGGFGGARFDHVGQFRDEDTAEIYAWELACDEYNGMAGLHGLRDIWEIVEEEGVNEGDAWEIYREERENWLDYRVVELKEGQTEKDFE